MGTTGTAIASSDGLGDYQVVIAIEGYPNLLTDGPAADAVTAWSGTEFTAALAGLSVKWDIEQTLDPWDPSPDVSSLSFSMMDADGNDTFGIAAFGTARGAETLLNASIDCNDTTVTVLTTGSFASSGTIYIGTEAINYTGKTATTFTTCTRGRYSPFKASSESSLRFGRNHPLPNVGDGVVLPPRVTSVPDVWEGRLVGVWLHRRAGATLDVIAQAQCVWAGRITSTRDEANGLTYVECEDVKSLVRDCELWRDQWKARIKQGIYLRPGVRFEAWDAEASSRLDANDLVVTDSASGDNQIEDGVTTLETLSNALNNWLLAEKVAGRLNMFWRFDPRIFLEDGTSRSRFSWTAGSSTDVNRVYIKCSEPSVWRFFGWGDVDFVREDWEENSSFEEISPEPPRRILMTRYGTLPVVDESGTFWDNQPYAPDAAGIVANASGTWGFVQFDDGLIAPCEKSGTNILPTQYGRPLLNAIAGQNFTTGNLNEILLAERTVDEEGDILVKQVAIIEGTFRDLLTRCLASTGTASYNGTYDVFPAQLGAAIPWGLLSDNWVSSVGNVSEGIANQIVVLEKRTRLIDKFGGQMVAALASLQWKDAGLQCVTWASPNSVNYEHTFSESNKAESDKVTASQMTVANVTDKFLVTSVKVEYNRVLSGGYLSTDEVRDASAGYYMGRTRVVTISLPNIYGPPVGTGTGTIEALLDGLKATVPLFSKPLRVLKRKINGSYFDGVAPGDQCLISDNHVRDPATGTRGITSKPGIVMSVSVDWGGYETDSGSLRDANGDVEIVISPRDRVSRYSPCAEVDFDAANAGYDVGNDQLTTRDHQHSNSAAPIDATHFDVGDAVEIVEIDPDTAASPTRWSRTVSAVNGNKIAVSPALSAPAWDATKRYRIISRYYDDGPVSTQQQDVYQADTSGLVDTEQPYEYGYNAGGANTFTEDQSVQYARLPATIAYDPLAPLDTGYEQDIAKLVNALCWGRTALCAPYLSRNIMGYVDVGIIRKILAVIPIHVGPGRLQTDVRRKLYVTPWLRRATAGADATMYVSLCRHRPAGTSLSLTSTAAPEYQLIGPYSTVSWATGSATWAEGATSSALDTALCDPFTGLGYLVIEGTSSLQTRGLMQIMTGLPE